ncbi:hypothetical protein GQ44DRAFT_684228 [Phaeosphaeriaceae sp. PMI808]|nr:hypothetical protein GQ44DRAFT_684228 [Phaeosphaeriaceae sp. PMI808]
MEHSKIRRKRAEDLVALQKITPERPYSILHRLQLARAYKVLGYPDLAAGDAYKALLLIDEVIEEGEYHEEALEAAKVDYMSERLANLVIKCHGEQDLDKDDSTINWAQTDCSMTAYNILIDCLLDCENLRSAYGYITRAQNAFPNSPTFEKHEVALSKRISSYFETEDQDPHDVDDYPDKGLVRREQYQWNEYEPDRSSDECLEFLNKELSIQAPKLEVKISTLPLLSTNTMECSSASSIEYVKQLGVFAKEDIPPGEQILEEKSLLTAISRLHDSYCDACSLALPNSQDDLVPCVECDEVYFCSTECHDLAQDSYHPSLCGVTVNQGKVPASEAADALYTSLLVRALALAETQGLHPLELKELRYIWGDYHGHDLNKVWRPNFEDQQTDAFCSVPRTLPFSFKSSVLTPLHMLENMEVNIFTQSHRYDTWVFNTILAKLRGTASAKQGQDGRPEIGAVHPLWCLANHSCDPNVAWEWQGSMRFWTREECIKWKGKESTRAPGIKKGEEVFSHYCDVRLPVKERREWAVGALGGDCVCPRCLWEEAEEKLHWSTIM